MKPSSASLSKYLAARSDTTPWSIHGTARRDFAGAVVVPALAEIERLPQLLHSLAANDAAWLEKFLVLVVVNHREDACPWEKSENHQTLEWMKSGSAPSALHLAWIDAASPGLELPVTNGGVGLARKIGFDLALSHLDWRVDPILVSLDADTLVRRNYLQVLGGHFRTSTAGGAVLPFRHREEAGPGTAHAIQLYELYLRHYVLGLGRARSPYGFHTVGSALACRADAYLRAGGMNRRRAGEDFYFLQQLAKTSGVESLEGTVVYPSDRPSGKTPFGTGRSVSRLLAGEREAVRFYHPETFRLLGAWLELVRLHWQSSAPEILRKARELHPGVAVYLAERGLEGAWSALRRNHPEPEAFLRGFHCWFDGLKTLRFIHALSAGPFPRCQWQNALPDLLGEAGLPWSGDLSECLETLRRHQGAGEPFFQ